MGENHTQGQPEQTEDKPSRQPLRPPRLNGDGQHLWRALQFEDLPIAQAGPDTHDTARTCHALREARNNAIARMQPVRTLHGLGDIFPALDLPAPTLVDGLRTDIDPQASHENFGPGGCSPASDGEFSSHWVVGDSVNGTCPRHTLCGEQQTAKKQREKSNPADYRPKPNVVQYLQLDGFAAPCCGCLRNRLIPVPGLMLTNASHGFVEIPLAAFLEPGFGHLRTQGFQARAGAIFGLDAHDDSAFFALAPG